MKFKQALVIIFLLGIVLPAFTQEYVRLAPPVNDEDAHQSSPAISPDGQLLAFTSDRSGTWQVYISRLKEGAWQQPEKINAIDAMFNGPVKVAGLCFNHDHSRIYFAAYPAGSPGQSDIYFTALKSGEWQVPEKLPMEINSGAFEGTPSLSIDRNTLYFTRARTNIEDKDLRNKNCRELFFARRNAGGEWKEARSIPKPVNRVCDNTPFILSDGTTLMLSSIRPPKTDKEGNEVETPHGGYDIYKSRNLAQRIWSTPSLLDAGEPFHELHFSSDALSQKAYLSMQKSGRNEKSQIYEIDMQDVTLGNPVMVMQGKIQQAKTNEPLQADIDVIRKRTSQVITTFQSRPDGTYYLVLPPGDDYVLDVSKKGYSHDFLEYNLSGLKETRVVNKNMELYASVALQLNVFDQEIYEPLEAKISVYEKEGMKPLDISPDMLSQGRYMLRLPIGSEYSITANKKFYNPFSIDLDLSGVVQFDQFERDMELKPKKREIEIDVSDEETEEGMAVEIVITNMERNERIVREAKKNKDGKYMVELREGDRYEINVNSPKGYAFYNKKLDMNEDKKSRKLDVKMKPLKAETKLQLSNITFETNSAELDASSFEELDRVVKLLNDNDNIRIEISAHTDDVGSNTYNKRLSNRRAASVVEYLQENGVSREQLVSSGYGENQPLVPNNSEENRAKNRRVELEILEVLEDGTVKQRAESKADFETQEK